MIFQINRIISDNNIDNLIVNTFKEITVINNAFDSIVLKVQNIHTQNNELDINKIKDLFVE